jgi:hypothetical protein
MVVVGFMVVVVAVVVVWLLVMVVDSLVSGLSKVFYFLTTNER